MEYEPIPKMDLIERRLAEYDPAIGEIDLALCFIDDDIIGPTVARLATLDGLRALNIGYNEFGEAGAIALAKQMKGLTQFGIEWINISDAGMIEIADALPTLIQINIMHTRVGEAGAIALATRLPLLEKLHIGNNLIGDKSMLAIAEHLPKLTFLDITEAGIGDAGTIAIAHGLPKLTSLFAARNHIGDAGAIALMERLSQLTTLQLSSNQIVSARRIARSLQKCTSPLRASIFEGIALWGNPLRWPGMSEKIPDGLLRTPNPTELLTRLGEPGEKSSDGSEVTQKSCTPDYERCRISVDIETCQIWLDDRELSKGRRFAPLACEALQQLIQAKGKMLSPYDLVQQDRSFETPHKNRVLRIIKQLPPEIKSFIVGEGKHDGGRYLLPSAYHTKDAQAHP